MNTINSWKSKTKQKAKFEITIRISTITLFEINIDLSKKSYSFMLLNPYTKVNSLLTEILCANGSCPIF